MYTAISKKVVFWKVMLGHVDTAVISRPYTCIAMYPHGKISRQRCDDARVKFTAATGFFSQDMFVFWTRVDMYVIGVHMHETIEIFSVTVIAVVSNFTFLNVCYT